MPDGRILIVEDDVALEARPLERMLKAHGYQVLAIAQSTEDAVRMAAAHKPDVVLMDLRIPHLTGDQALENEGIRAAVEVRRITDASVIFVTLTAVSDELNQMAQAVSPGAKFITKPWHEDQVLTHLKLALTERRGSRVVFVAYAHKDAPMKNEMAPFLDALRDIGVSWWHDNHIWSGQRWKDEIAAALERANCAVLLVSIDFMNSTFIKEIELPTMLKAQRSGRMEVIPVYVRRVPEDLLRKAGLLDFQGINDHTKPLKALKSPADRDKYAWIPLSERLMKDWVP